MKRYYMSIIDFSEITNVTATEQKIELAKKEMMELGLLTEKGNPSTSAIGSVTKQYMPHLFNKLSKRLRRRENGFQEIRDTLKKLYNEKEYIGFYMYLSFLYGFVEWAVPKRISLLPANNDVLKVFEAEVLKELDLFLSKDKSE